MPYRRLAWRRRGRCACRDPQHLPPPLARHCAQRRVEAAAGHIGVAPQQGEGRPKLARPARSKQVCAGQVWARGVAAGTRSVMHRRAFPGRGNKGDRR